MNRRALLTSKALVAVIVIVMIFLFYYVVPSDVRQTITNALVSMGR